MSDLVVSARRPGPVLSAKRMLLGWRYAHFFARRNVIFIHIPKAAGLSVFEALFGCESFGHYSLGFYQRHMRSAAYQKCFKMTFVRDPYERLYSVYSYLKKGGRGKPKDLQYQAALAAVDCFETFAADWLNEQRLFEIEHLIPQSCWLKNRQGTIEMDYVGRMETLDADYAHVAHQVDAECVSLPHVNIGSARPSVPIRELFAPHMTKNINRLYKEDFEILGYPVLKEEEGR